RLACRPPAPGRLARAEAGTVRDLALPRRDREPRGPGLRGPQPSASDRGLIRTKKDRRWEPAIRQKKILEFATGQAENLGHRVVGGRLRSLQPSRVGLISATPAPASALIFDAPGARSGSRTHPCEHQPVIRARLPSPAGASACSLACS